MSVGGILSICNVFQKVIKGAPISNYLVTWWMDSTGPTEEGNASSKSTPQQTETASPRLPSGRRYSSSYEYNDPHQPYPHQTVVIKQDNSICDCCLGCLLGCCCCWLCCRECCCDCCC
ncbi:hypothetical protein V3C99_009546 [Haemonchus contortus]